MASKFLIEHILLSLEWFVAIIVAPLRDSMQRSSESVGCRSRLDHPFTRHGTFAPVDGEAEEVEGARRVGPVVDATPPRHPVRPFERHQPGFVRMQRQTVLAESLRQDGHDAASVLLVLEQHHGVVGVSNEVGTAAQARSHFPFEPPVKHRVQEDIRKYG